MDDLKKLEEEQKFLTKAINTQKEKDDLDKKVIEIRSEIDMVKKEKEKIEKLLQKELKLKKKEEKPEVIEAEKIVKKPHDEDFFKDQEKSRWYNPMSWFNADKTNPMVMVIFSPAGDLTIRERVADGRSNLKLGKNTLYRIEHNSVWDIAESDVVGFRGKKVLFYFQDVANPIDINRDDTKTDVTINTETYARSQKSHLVSELLSAEMSFSDYLTMILSGISILLTLVVIFKLFFMK